MQIEGISIVGSQKYLSQMPGGHVRRMTECLMEIRKEVGVSHESCILGGCEARW